MNRFGVFWLQCCPDKVLFQLQVGAQQWSRTSLCAPKAQGSGPARIEPTPPTVGSVCAEGAELPAVPVSLISAGVINAAWGARAQPGQMSQRGHPENLWLPEESEGSLRLPR